ncbi:MAG: 30S ribosomal protein S17 [Candidatus Omnitrophota bacterium]
MGKRKEFTGTVISDKMQKTIIVRIATLRKHKKYGKRIRKFNKYKVHDELGAAHMGDRVRIVETRPLSKDKRFRLVQIVKKAQTTHLAEEEKKEE